MPQPKSSSGGSKGSKPISSGARQQSRTAAAITAAQAASAKPPAEAKSSLAEQVVNRLFNPLDLVVLTRDRIQDVLDDAAERGRVTRTDANELVSELIRKS